MLGKMTVGQALQYKYVVWAEDRDSRRKAMQVWCKTAEERKDAEGYLRGARDMFGVARIVGWSRHAEPLPGEPWFKYDSWDKHVYTADIEDI